MKMHYFSILFTLAVGGCAHTQELTQKQRTAAVNKCAFGTVWRQGISDPYIGELMRLCHWRWDPDEGTVPSKYDVCAFKALNPKFKVKQIKKIIQHCYIEYVNEILPESAR